MRKHGNRRWIALMAAMVVVLTTIMAPVGAAAAEKMDLTKSGKASLTLQLPAASDSVKLYQVVDFDDEAKVVMKKEAADLKVTIDSKDSAATLSEKAKTLAGKLTGKPAVGKTDAAYKVKFDNLKLGYYLVVVDKCASDTANYTIAPMIVSVPAADKSALTYDVSVKLQGTAESTKEVPATTTPKAGAAGTSEGTVGNGNTTEDDDLDSTPTSTSTPAVSQTPTASSTPDGTIETPEIPVNPTTTVTTTSSITETATPSTADESGITNPTVTPADESGITNPTVTPADESGITNPTVTPADESGITNPTVTPADESGITNPTVTPADESGITNPTVTPADESGITNPTVTPPDDSSISDPSVTPDPNKWQLSVTKYWVDKNNIALDKDAITVDVLPIQIWKKGAAEDAKWEKVEIVELTAKDNWTYSWEADDDGYTWTVSEPVTPTGFTQLTIKQSKNADKKTLAFRVTNESSADVTPAPRQLSVVKYWKDKSDNDLPADEIGVKSLPIRIYRREKAEGAAWAIYDKIELTAENGWEYHWGAADDGADWTVTESDVPEGYTLTEPIVLAHNSDWTKIQFRVTNVTKKGPDPSTITPTTTETVTPTPTVPAGKRALSAVMLWKDTDGVTDLAPDKVTVTSVPVQIYKKTVEGKWEKVEEVTLKKSEDWTYSWLADDDETTWTVTETVPNGYDKVSIMQAKAEGGKRLTFKITNKMKDPKATNTPTPTTVPSGSISYSVTKSWIGTTGQTLTSSQIGVSSLTVTIYKKALGETSYTAVETIELLPSKNWTYSWTAPDDGSTWTVTEPNVPSGYTKKSITQATNDSKKTKLFTITNQKSSGSSNSNGSSSSTTKKATVTPTAKAVTRTTPNTGDTQNIWIPLATCIGAGVVLMMLVRKRAR